MQPVSTFPTALYPLLRCPVCKQALKHLDDRFECMNSGCNSIFPTVHGIPVLINEQRSVFTIDDFVRQRQTFFAKPRMRPIELIERVLPELQRADKAGKLYQRFAQLLLERSTNPLVLVVGGGIEGRGMKPLLQYCPPIQLLDSDVSFGPRTMLICDAHDIPFADGTFDGVVAQAVLEHVVDPGRCVEEIHRVLKGDGLVYAQTPFMQQVHGGAYDFTRFTLLGHRRLFRKFAEIEGGAGNGPGAALAWSWQYFLLSFVTSWWARGLIRSFVRLTAFWLKYVDIYLDRKPGTLDAATGFFFLGRKSDKLLSDRELITLYRGGLIR